MKKSSNKKNAGAGEVSEQVKVFAALVWHPKFSIQNPYKYGRREFLEDELPKLPSDLHKDVLAFIHLLPPHTSCTYTSCTQLHTHMHACIYVHTDTQNNDKF